MNEYREIPVGSIEEYAESIIGYIESLIEKLGNKPQAMLGSIRSLMLKKNYLHAAMLMRNFISVASEEDDEESYGKREERLFVRDLLVDVKKHIDGFYCAYQAESFTDEDQKIIVAAIDEHAPKTA